MNRTQFVLFAAALLLRPGYSAAGIPALVPVLEYVVRVDDLASRELHVTLRVSGVEGDSLLVHGVPVYMDNPTPAAADSAVRDLSAVTETGSALSVTRVGTSDGHPAWWVVGSPRPIITYTVFADFTQSEQTENYNVLIPYMSRDQAWLYGNTVFCFPQLGRDMRTTATVGSHITVDFELAEGVPLVAVPGAIVLRNVYQLMSLQFGLGDFVTTSASTNGVDFDVIHRAPDDFTGEETARLVEMTKEMIDAEVEYFGGAPFDRFTMLYFRDARIGGLEGSNACQIYVSSDVDITDVDDRKTRMFSMVAVHELFHTWNPIYVTATEDPWIKEGVSSYCDMVIGSRLGYLTEADVAKAWDGYYDLLGKNPTMSEIALTDPRLWTREYDGEEWRTITYDRGAATALMLDVFIREATDNRRSLDHVLAGLFKRYANNSYTHDELMETILATTGVNPHRFFVRYVDGTRPPTREDIEQAHARAVELGVFGNRIATDGAEGP